MRIRFGSHSRKAVRVPYSHTPAANGLSLPNPPARRNSTLSRFKRTANGSLPRRSRFSAKPDGTHPSAERRMATPYAFYGGISTQACRETLYFFSSGNECGVRKGFSPPRLRRLSPASTAESKRKFSLQNKMIAIYFIIVGYFLLHKLYFLR